MIVGVDSLEAATQLSAAHGRAGTPVGGLHRGRYRSASLRESWSGRPTVQLGLDIARMPGLRLIGVFSHEGHANAQPKESIAEVARRGRSGAGRNRRGAAPARRRHRGRQRRLDPGRGDHAVGPRRHRDAPRHLRLPRHHRVPLRHLRTGSLRGAGRRDRRQPRRARPLHRRRRRRRRSRSTRSPGHPGHGYIVGHPGSVIHALSEEHGWVQIPPDDPGFTIGERVEIIPNHICPAINLHDELASSATATSSTPGP